MGFNDDPVCSEYKMIKVFYKIQINFMIDRQGRETIFVLLVIQKCLAVTSDCDSGMVDLIYFSYELKE